MALTRAQRAALAEIGRQGGRTKGASKRRSPEHYARLAQMRRAKRKAPTP